MWVPGEQGPGAPERPPTIVRATAIAAGQRGVYSGTYGVSHCSGEDGRQPEQGSGSRVPDRWSTIYPQGRRQRGVVHHAGRRIASPYRPQSSLNAFLGGAAPTGPEGRQLASTPYRHWRGGRTVLAVGLS